MKQSLTPETSNAIDVTVLRERETALQERLKSLEAKLGENGAKREALMAKLKADEAARLEAIGNAKVKELVREGQLTGNSVKTFRDVYFSVLKGETVTPAQMKALAASLPKMSARR